MKSNMLDHLGFTPIAKDGPVTLEIDGMGRLVISDGINTSWPVFYRTGLWKLDGPLAATGQVREVLCKLHALYQDHTTPRRNSGKQGG